MTTGSIGGSRPGPKDHGGVSPKVGKFSEQDWGISSERQHCADPATWGSPGTDAEALSARYGLLRVMAWPRMHQAVHRRGGDWNGCPR